MQQAVVRGENTMWWGVENTSKHSVECRCDRKCPTVDSLKVQLFTKAIQMQRFCSFNSFALALLLKHDLSTHKPFTWKSEVVFIFCLLKPGNDFIFSTLNWFEVNFADFQKSIIYTMLELAQWSFHLSSSALLDNLSSNNRPVLDWTAPK